MQRMRKLRRPHKALWRLLLFTLSDKPGWFLKVQKCPVREMILIQSINLIIITRMHHLVGRNSNVVCDKPNAAISKAKIDSAWM